MRPLIDIIHVDFGTGDWAHNGDLLRCPDVLDTLNPTVQSQYSASTAIRWLCQYDRQLLCTLDERSLFYDFEFNPRSAIGYGLDVWGRIVGIERVLSVLDNLWLGYKGTGFQPLSQAPAWAGVRAYTRQRLGDVAFRTLIFFKAAANLSTADAAALNKLLQRMFPGQPVYVLDRGRMRIRLVVGFELSPVWRAALQRYGLLARGAAVGVELLEIFGEFLGFSGSGFAPFGQAPFWRGGVYQLMNQGE